MLYPDHVVFLGPEAKIVNFNTTLNQIGTNPDNTPPFLFLISEGVYETTGVTQGQISQLKCYYDVLMRQSSKQNLKSVNSFQILEWLNWESEKYR